MFQFGRFFTPGNFRKIFVRNPDAVTHPLHIQILVTRTHPSVTDDPSLELFVNNRHFLPIIKNFSQNINVIRIVKKSTKF